MKEKIMLKLNSNLLNWGYDWIQVSKITFFFFTQDDYNEKFPRKSVDDEPMEIDDYDHNSKRYANKDAPSKKENFMKYCSTLN